jgi:hypothetical protein
MKRFNVAFGLLLALGAAAVVAVVGSAPAHASGPWVWSTSLAKSEVAKTLGGTTVCVPAGSPFRQGGINYYRQFSCGVAFSNGASYAITIAPKSGTSFSLLSRRQVSAGTTTPVSPAPTYTPPPSSTPPPTSAPSPTYTSPGCPAGWYQNVYGNCIPGPSTSPTLPVPGGPTAICSDGTYSYSQTRSGTCSYHGGVSTWLN